MNLDARIADRMLKREILRPVGELSATVNPITEQLPVTRHPGLLSDVRSSTTTRPTLLLKVKSCQHGFRDAFLDWLDNENSGRKSR
jgi:hypothetical protein